MSAVWRQYHPWDITLDSAVPHANPFVVDVRARAEGPDGQTIVVPDFYDSNATWKARFCPTMPGPWRYSTDPQLNGRASRVSLRET
jgi:hypothetical protein